MSDHRLPPSFLFGRFLFAETLADLGVRDQAADACKKVIFSMFICFLQDIIFSLCVCVRARVRLFLRACVFACATYSKRNTTVFVRACMHAICTCDVCACARAEEQHKSYLCGRTSFPLVVPRRFSSFADRTSQYGGHPGLGTPRAQPLRTVRRVIRFLTAKSCLELALIECQAHAHRRERTHHTPSTSIRALMHARKGLQVCRELLPAFLSLSLSLIPVLFLSLAHARAQT